LNLKRLEVRGFKSFADKLELSFSGGVTCIVGPNGCGKSNSADAIRWVLGEQSPKLLRAKSMQEVIFGGTSSRKPLPSCEVTLVFDNVGRFYRIDMDEFSITRKLYRTGDANYYINGEKARLKDIQSLFNDTGIGKDGYSIVGQNRVEEFLTAKPEDRRLVFDEAAGITKWKEARKEAVNKLDRTNINLDSVRREMAGTENRLAPLRVQAETAIKAKTLKARLKEIEVNHFLYLCDNAESQIKEVREKIDRLDAELFDVETSKNQAESDYTALNRRRNELDAETSFLYDKKIKLTAEAAKKGEKTKALGEKLDLLRADVAALENEIRDKTKQIELNKNARDANKEEHGRVNDRFNMAKNEEAELTALCTDLEKEVERRRQEKEVTNEMIIQSVSSWGAKHGDLSRIKAEVLSLKNALAEHEKGLADARATLQDERNKLYEYEKSLEKYNLDKKEKRRLKDDIGHFLNDKQGFLQEAMDKAAELNDTRIRLKTYLENLESSKRNNSGYSRGVQVLLNSKDDRILSRVLGVVGNIITVPATYSTAIGIALGGRINNIITKDHADTNFLIEQLKLMSASATFLPLTAMKSAPPSQTYLNALDEDGVLGLASDLIKCDKIFKPAIEVLLSRIIIVQDKETASGLIRKFGNALNMVALDGTRYETSGAVTGGAVDKGGKDSGLLALDAQIADTQNKLAKCEAAYKIMQQEIATAKEEVRTAENESRILDGVIYGIDKSIGIEEQSKAYTTANVEKCENQVERFQMLIDGTHKEIFAKQLSLQNVEQDVTTKNTEAGDTKDVISGLSAEIAKKEAELSTARRKLTDTLIKARSLEAKLGELANEIMHANNTLRRLSDEIANADVNLRMKKTDEAAAMRELEQMVMVSVDHEQLDALTEEINRNESEKVTIELNSRKLHEESKRLTEEITHIREMRAKLEAAEEKIKSDINASRDRVKEDYDIEYDAAVSLRIENYDDAKGMSEAKVLRKDITALGEVNEKAIDDLAELSAGYDQMKIHFDDIISAKQSLEDTINDLTKKMSEKFMETFAKIKANFEVVFTELFAGGSAKLELEMEPGGSVLDAGVTIFAEPPGKRLQNMSLLSGGERALIAIAVIFAIIKLQPIPFCVLDEVDAPLDESNADTYARFLRKFSKKTQFIIVSHRKVTMQLADRIYGITMQEKGVSRPLALSMKEAEKMLGDAQ